MVIIEIFLNPNKQKKYVIYAMAEVNSCIILHIFCQDNKLEVDQIWLKERQVFDQKNQRREKDYTVNKQIFS